MLFVVVSLAMLREILDKSALQVWYIVGKNLSSELEKTVKNKIDISTLVRTQEDFHFVYIH